MDERQVYYFAILNNNIVDNVVWGYSKEEVEEFIGVPCIESTSNNPAHIGLGWDSVNGFEQPSVQE